MRTWLCDLKRAFRSVGFVAGVFGTAICIVLGCLPRILPFMKEETQAAPGFAASLYLEALSGKVFLSALPILCALPYTAVCMEELKSRFVRAGLPRSGRRAYTAGKIGACALSGGMTAAIGIIVGTVILFAVASPFEVPMPDGEEISILAQQTLVTFSGRVLLFFLSGILWALIGLGASLCTDSTYMAYAFPFIFYYFLLILTTRYLPSLYTLCPDQWTNPGNEWQAGIFGAALIMAELAMLAGLVCALMLERRLRDV